MFFFNNYQNIPSNKILIIYLVTNQCLEFRAKLTKVIGSCRIFTKKANTSLVYCSPFKRSIIQFNEL